MSPSEMCFGTGSTASVLPQNEAHAYGYEYGAPWESMGVQVRVGGVIHFVCSKREMDVVDIADSMNGWKTRSVGKCLWINGYLAKTSLDQKSSVYLPNSLDLEVCPLEVAVLGSKPANVGAAYPMRVVGALKDEVSVSCLLVGIAADEKSNMLSCLRSIEDVQARAPEQLLQLRNLLRQRRKADGEGNKFLDEDIKDIRLMNTHWAQDMVDHCHANWMALNEKSEKLSPSSSSQEGERQMPPGLAKSASQNSLHWDFPSSPDVTTSVSQTSLDAAWADQSVGFNQGEEKQGKKGDVGKWLPKFGQGGRGVDNKKKEKMKSVPKKVALFLRSLTKGFRPQLQSAGDLPVKIYPKKQASQEKVRVPSNRRSYTTSRTEEWFEEWAKSNAEEELPAEHAEIEESTESDAMRRRSVSLPLRGPSNPGHSRGTSFSSSLRELDSLSYLEDPSSLCKPFPAKSTAASTRPGRSSCPAPKSKSGVLQPSWQSSDSPADASPHPRRAKYRAARNVFGSAREGSAASEEEGLRIPPVRSMEKDPASLAPADRESQPHGPAQLPAAEIAAAPARSAIRATADIQSKGDTEERSLRAATEVNRETFGTPESAIVSKDRSPKKVFFEDLQAPLPVSSVGSGRLTATQHLHNMVVNEGAYLSDEQGDRSMMAEQSGPPGVNTQFVQVDAFDLVDSVSSKVPGSKTFVSGNLLQRSKTERLDRRHVALNGSLQERVWETAALPAQVSAQEQPKQESISGSCSWDSLQDAQGMPKFQNCRSFQEREANTPADDKWDFPVHRFTRTRSDCGRAPSYRSGYNQAGEDIREGEVMWSPQLVRTASVVVATKTFAERVKENKKLLEDEAT